MKPNPKIESRHLERSAYVYIRQSSPHQVSENLESQDLQYQLAGRAQRLGWREDQIVIIDDDVLKPNSAKILNSIKKVSPNIKIIFFRIIYPNI